MPETAHLNRSLSLPLITFYGLGTIIGAGIYVLIGAVASKAGMFAPVSFLLAALIAGFTAFSYAELSSRLPRSAGEAVYIQEAFGIHWLSVLTGWSVVAIGLVSSATIANGFVGYLEVFIHVTPWLAITILVAGLGLIAAIGINQSVWLATLITLLEIGGLLYVLVIAGSNLDQLPERWADLIPTMDDTTWNGIFIGAFLAFYAFIGFEDMVNVAEEVKDAPRLLPKAIIIALIASTLLYLSVAVVAVLSLPIEALANSDAPLASVVAASGHHNTLLISFISLIAVINGALIQIIMASRVLYGMGNTGMAFRFFARVNPHTQTPLISTVLVTISILALALWLPLVTLAQITSFITLIIFAGVNLALLKLKLRGRHAPGAVHYPIWVPVIGAILSLALLGIRSTVSV
jgi:APA family basic amino acid/polyamine antiporter